MYHQTLKPKNPPPPEFGRPPPDVHLPSNCLNPHSRPEAVIKDSIAARKVQKADHEKLRRDQLNEQFTELGTTIDPERPKNDRASILTDAIQMVKDLTAQINRLKSEHAGLNDEYHELTQEKNDLRDEKASLKSDIESLNAQYQQRLRAMYPWAGMDHSVVMHPTSYPFPMPMPMPMPIPAGPIPIHPSLQPYPLLEIKMLQLFQIPCQLLYRIWLLIASLNSNLLADPMLQVNKILDPKHQIRRIAEVKKGRLQMMLRLTLSSRPLGLHQNRDVSPGQRKAKISSRNESSVTDGSS